MNYIKENRKSSFRELIKRPPPHIINTLNKRKNTKKEITRNINNNYIDALVRNRSTRTCKVHKLAEDTPIRQNLTKIVLKLSDIKKRKKKKNPVSESVFNHPMLYNNS